MRSLAHYLILTLSDTGKLFAPSYQLYRNKSFLIGLTSRALFYSHITRSGQIWINFLQRVMRYDLFAEEKYDILRISHT